MVLELLKTDGIWVPCLPINLRKKSIAAVDPEAIVDASLQVA